MTKGEKLGSKNKKTTDIGSGGGEKRKKAIPVRKLLELERQQGCLDTVVNNENDLSDANRCPSSSILGSLERLVESSFKPNASGLDTVVNAAAQQVLLAKRAFGSVFGEEDCHDIDEKRVALQEEVTTPNATWSPSASPPGIVSNSTELKFLKYSELAKELSSGR